MKEMNNMLLKKSILIVLLFPILVLTTAATPSAPKKTGPKMGLLVPQPKIESFIKDWTQEAPWVPGYKVELAEDDKKKGGVYFYNMNDLNHDGVEEVLVYLVSRNFCGSGGCSLLILQQQNGVYNLISDFGVTQVPVGVFDQGKRGWKDLVLFNQIGQKQYVEFFEFQDGVYSSNHKTVNETAEIKKISDQVTLYLYRDGQK